MGSPLALAAATPRGLPFPPLAATVARRMLVSYRVDPGVARTLLPAGLRPQIVAGSAVAGVCLIHLEAVRPRAIRPAVGHRSRNAAHRIAVEWNTPEGTRTGVFIPHRHSSSRIARAVGGRLFPGIHTRADVRFDDTPDALSVRVDAADLQVEVAARRGPDIPFHSDLFPTLGEASAFFEKDAVGWSPTRSGTLEGLRFDTDAWRVEPLAVTHLQSSFFDALPRDAVAFDHALLMRDVPMRWSSPADAAPTPR